jgi:predicted phage terminase large subunit-like protein
VSTATEAYVSSALEMWGGTDNGIVSGGPEIRTFGTPGELAYAVNPLTVQTPALDLVDTALVTAYTTPSYRLILCLPPQEGKSTRVTVMGSLWALLQNPDLRIAIVSYEQDLADEFGREIRNTIITNNGDEGTLDLGLRIARDHGAASRFQLQGHKGVVRCVGIGGGITGRPADVLVIDDPVKNEATADSQTYRDTAKGFWRSSGATRLSPQGIVVVVTTRWHEDDLAGFLMNGEDGARWNVINIPALADHDPEAGETDPLGRKPGDWLVSARGRTDAQWEATRITVGARTFNALYQGRPSPDTGNVWKRNDWRRYDVPVWSVDPDTGCYYVPGADEVVQSWDFAFKDTKGSDYIAGWVLARQGANVYAVDLVCARLGFTDSIAAVKRITAKWPQATAKYIEDKANGPAVIESLGRSIPGFIAVEPEGSKYARAVATSPFVEAGNVLLPTNRIATWDVDAFIDQAAGFPNATHDDMVDGMSQGLKKLLLDGGGAADWLAFVKRQAEKKPAPEDGAEVIVLDPLEAARVAAFRARIPQGGRT